MNCLQASQEIKAIIPNIQNELKDHTVQNSYSVIQTFTTHIKKMIRQNHHGLLIKSIKKMNKIYKNGDLTLRNAIENTFIYSLDNFTAFCNEECKKVIFNTISADLRQIYSRQIYKSGM